MTSYDCKMCGAKNIHDWMVECNLCSKTMAICGPCKIEFGKRVQEEMVNGFAKSFTEASRNAKATCMDKVGHSN